MKIALVHDHLAQYGGAEKVLKAFQEIWPRAPIFTLVYDKRRAANFFQDKDIRCSFIQRLPWGLKKYQWFLPLMPLATEKYNLMDFDVVLSSSSAFAKGVITRPETIHICYCHTPTRYLWTDTYSYIEELPYPRLIKLIIPLVLSYIRIWDRVASDRVDKFIVNSQVVAQRVRKYYRRESTVIYPPVETKKFKISQDLGNYYLIGGRLVAYKRFDLAIQAFNKLGIPLKVFGSGPEIKNLRKKAKANIEFLGQISEERMAELYSKCLAFIYPQEEDFGITAVEAMASGRPVIAYKKGGALETVIEGVTGKFFDEQCWESLADSVVRFKAKDYDPQKIRKHALNFDIEIFKKRIKEFVEPRTF